MITLLSVIIPIHNLENVISATLIDLFKQIDLRIEVIIVDDGSSDNTRSVVNNVILEFQELRIRFFQCAKNGVSSARNYGLSIAQGKYIIFLDGDDFLHLNDEFIELISESNSDMLIFEYSIDTYGKRKSILLDSRLSNNILYSGHDLINLKFKHKIELNMWTTSVVFSKKFIEENILLFDIQVRIGQVFLFFHQALLLARIVSFHRYNLSTYVIRNGSSTNRIHIGLLDILSALNKLFISIKNNGHLNLGIHLGLLRNYYGKVIELSRVVRNLDSEKEYYNKLLEEYVNSSSIIKYKALKILTNLLISSYF
jgi:glycosyltransferase involved in cell wall biosynthesis